MSNVAGMKDCIDTLATKRGITKVEADSILHDVLDVISEKCVEGGVAFKDVLTIKQKVIKGRKGVMNGYEWETDDKVSLKITVGKKLEEKLNNK